MDNGVNEEKLYAMLREIRRFENNNVKTQRFDDKKVVNKLVEYLQKIAEREVEKGEI